jgi:biopolymer transport protein ExbD
MKIRHSTTGVDKVNLDMTPMIDCVFQLLIFFIMSLKIVTPEGDFNVSMPQLTPSEGEPEEEKSRYPIKLEMDGAGNLTNIIHDGSNWGTNWQAVQADLVAKVGADTGPNSARAKSEIEIDAPYNLHYRHIIEGLNYLTGQKAGENVVKLIENVKFKPQPKPAAG